MISIPEPCHEDFSKMTPTQRGAFCSKCQIDTFDFRKLNDQDINRIILENKGQHLCGQFNNSQLDSLNRGFIQWKNQKQKTFRSKFILALIMVFGLTLFSCNSTDKQQIIDLQAVTLIGNPTEKLEFINEVQNERDLNLTDFVELPNPLDDTKCYKIDEVEDAELLDEELIIQDYVTAGIPAYPEPQIAGGMVAPHYMEYLEDTVQSTVPNLVEVDVDVFEARAFPNPTVADASLALEVHQKGQFEIIVYDMSGRLIQSVYSGELLAGRQNFPIELAHENSGLYLIKIVSETQSETVKVQKVN